MQSRSKIYTLRHLAQNKKNQGFTLIEILVTVIIIGVLASFALPNVLGQTAKARQAEAKLDLGTIDRAQQSYKGEKGTFTRLTNPFLGVVIQGVYYNFSGPVSDNGTYASHSASAISTYVNDIKNYASAVSVDNNGNFAAVVCESLDVASTAGGAVSPGTSYAAITGGTPCAIGHQIN